MTLPDGTPAAAIVRIPFHGTEIHTTLVDGEPHVVLRPTLEAMGLDYSAQLKKLKGKSWATVAETATVAEDGKVRDMATINLDAWAMLLANIDENRVALAIKPLVIEYQKESAKALRDFWTKGGAINPGATDDQLAAMQEEIRAEMRERRMLSIAHGRVSLLSAMNGVDEEWRNGQYKHLYAVVTGTKPDIAPGDRLLMADPYLTERGVAKADLASIRSTFGKRLKAAYVLAYGEEPGEVPAQINGRERMVKAYYERHRHLFDEVFARYYSHLAGPAQLELGGAA
ncbi:phage antirepressor N-terminal domain-containing protein [Micromonospora sp. WMMD1102]|uniref:phage antirepressor N-terminal domain-containing protein n=1 Tax=Micromonospora sp. WMMD1102 TaxID=3016105 RepID=UPI002415129E|nr:phage antirepressor N-terminal domain-containing protein [Micromonospora sp. WMMD1102]MDG4791943.1 phage antirepressor N-terminal domain-containing protein [Micromonospora sp. WMMD1102]